MFGRKKHIAAIERSAVEAEQAAEPRLSEEQLFAIVQGDLMRVFGDGGEWTVVRRTPAETDSFFHELFVHSLAAGVTAAVSAAQSPQPLAAEAAAPQAAGEPALEAPLDELAPDAVASAAGTARASLGAAGLETADGLPAGPEDEEPAALPWVPAPITLWADLKRPVTGPLAVVDAA